MQKFIVSVIMLIAGISSAMNVYAQYLIYDDKMALEVYSQEFVSRPKDELVVMIDDRQEDSYKRAAAVNVLRGNFFTGLSGKERIEIADFLRQSFRNSGSSFIRIEIAYALCQLERDKYFKDMVSFLLRRIDNENNVISERAYDRAQKILSEGDKSTAEAKVVLSVLKNVSPGTAEGKNSGMDLRANQKLELIAWANNILNR